MPSVQRLSTDSPCATLGLGSIKGPLLHAINSRAGLIHSLLFLTNFLLPFYEVKNNSFNAHVVLIRIYLTQHAFLRWSFTLGRVYRGRAHSQPNACPAEAAAATAELW